MKQIPNCPEYSITKEGKVYSHLKPGGYGNGKVLDYTYAREFKPQINNRGYLCVQLYSNTPKCKSYSVHRLVAEAYIPNPNNLPQVNHINEDKTDNRVENLEWISSVDNIRYSKCKNWTIQTPTGEIVETDNLPVFCEENNLTSSLLRRTLRNKDKGWKHKGFAILSMN